MKFCIVLLVIVQGFGSLAYALSVEQIRKAAIDRVITQVRQTEHFDYGFSVGVRYGNEGNQYLSPHARDTEKMNVLYQKYNKEAK